VDRAEAQGAAQRAGHHLNDAVGVAAGEGRHGRAAGLDAVTRSVLDRRPHRRSACGRGL
jgi:hypothetical protein